jgi:hypothetical protein
LIASFANFLKSTVFMVSQLGVSTTVCCLFSVVNSRKPSNVTQEFELFSKIFFR